MKTLLAHCCNKGVGMRASRKLPWFLAVAAVLWPGQALASEVITHPYQGVTYITRTDTMSAGNVNMHIALIDLTAPGIHFKVTGPSGARETTRQTTLGFLNEENAQLAINSHFFSTDSAADAWLTGLAASNGNVYSSFDPQPAATGQPNQSYAIIPYAPALNIDAANHAEIVHRNASYADNKHVLEPVTLWNTVAGSAQIVTNGVKSIPTYAPSGPLSAISGYSNSNSWYNQDKARTSIGLTQDNNTLVLFTADAAGGSAGVKVGEIADLLISEYQVYNALNLDGGGSTTMALRDPTTGIGSVVNVSADNPAGRAVGSNLAVFAEVPEPSTVCLVLAGACGAVVFCHAPEAGRQAFRIQLTPSRKGQQRDTFPALGGRERRVRLHPAHRTLLRLSTAP